jgi:S-adenosylmethionine hydrolase
MIALFTDFGSSGPYVGQMHAVLAMTVPGTPVVDLLHDLPPYDISAAAYLLPAYAAIFPPQTVFICIVDPGVGGERRPLALQADGKWYVGPDNGLFNLVLRRARHAEVHEIDWRPPNLSASFHARDLFAPVAARLVLGELPESRPVTLAPPPANAWPDDLPRVLYIDGYGNGISGVRSSHIPNNSVLRVRGQAVAHARVFSDVPPGQAFWYGNANGLVEIAVNRASAQRVLGLAVGDGFDW